MSGLLYSTNLVVPFSHSTWDIIYHLLWMYKVGGIRLWGEEEEEKEEEHTKDKNGTVSQK